MGNPTMTVIFDRKKKVAKTGKGKIDVCIYFGKQSRKFITVAEATPDNWERIANSCAVKAKLEKMKSILQGMIILDEEMTVENFNKHLERIEASEKINPVPKKMYNGTDQSSSFPDYMEDCIMSEKISKGTRKHKMVVVRAIRAFGKLEHFSDLTPANIIAFDKWVKEQDTCCQASIYDNYHKKVRMYTRQLYISEMIPRNPYEGLKFPRGRYKERKPLTEEELKKLRDLPLDGKLEHVRDLFVFSAYTGLAFCDVMRFKFKQAAEKVGDMYYIDGKRLKSGVDFFTPILPPAMDVLKKYNFKLPRYTNQKANDYLHVIEARLDLNKPMTFHVARHSFATLVLSHDIPIENLARMMGHTDIKTTKIYAKILKKTIERFSDKLKDELL